MEALKPERGSEATLRKGGTEGMSLGMGGGTGEGSQQAAPEGITRRLLIRTQANEVQGRSAHTNAASVSFHGGHLAIKNKPTVFTASPETGPGRSTNASNRTRSSVLLFTGAQFPPGIQNRMLFEISIQGCLQFHLAIKDESVLAARWNIFQEGWKIEKK